MNKISHSIIETLSQEQQGNVISLYCPTHKASTPQHIKSDKTRLENLISQATKEWHELNPDMSLATEQQLTQAPDSNDFWENMTEGIAIFINQSAIEVVHLPVECDEYVCVDSSFDVSPLKIMLEMDQPYYVFALALHDPKLFFGDMYGLTPVDIDFPDSPEDALNIDEMFSGSNTIRGVSTQGAGNDKLSSHGQGDSNHAGQEERLKYFRIIDNILITSKEVDTDLPFIIAATESEAADYRTHSKLPHIVNQIIAGNHTASKLADLHERSWAIITSEILYPRTKAALDSFNELKGLKRASSDIDDIAEALKEGRVDTLMIGVAEKTNDSVDDSDRMKEKTLLRLKKMFGDKTIRKLIASTYEQGGKVIGADPELLAMPSNLAALYRY